MSPEEMIDALAECYLLSGADPDGNDVDGERWRLAPNAVEEVRRLRAGFDRAEELNLQLEALVSVLEVYDLDEAPAPVLHLAKLARAALREADRAETAWPEVVIPLFEPNGEANVHPDGSVSVDGWDVWELAGEWVQAVAAPDATIYHKGPINTVDEVLDVLEASGVNVEKARKVWLRRELPEKCRDPDGVVGTLHPRDPVSNSYLFVPDGSKTPAVIGPGVWDPRRYLGEDDLKGYSFVPSEVAP